MFRLLLICSLILNVLSFRGQSRLTVEAADSLDFILSINDVQVNNLACLYITLDNLASGKTNVKATFPKFPELNIIQVINLKKNSSVFYELERNKGSYKFVLKSESTLELEDPTHVGEVKATGQAAAEEMPSAHLESADTKSSEGCDNPTSQQTYDEMIEEVRIAYFETRKLELMKEFVIHSCLRVEQIRYMMSRLSMEENKFLLLKESRDHILDTSNLASVEEDFFLEKNKARVHDLISGK